MTRSVFGVRLNEHRFQHQQRRQPTSQGYDWKDRGSDYVAPCLDASSLDSVVKDVYEPSEATLSRPEAEVQAFLQKHSVSIEGSDPPRPVLAINELQLPGALAKSLRALTSPTAIQSLCWPTALSGRNMIGIAQTGSGKTLGFLLPGMMHALAQEKVGGKRAPIVCVICPTRELAQQVQSVCRDHEDAAGLRSAAVFGGANRNPQAWALKNGVDMLVGTPGRILDFLSSGVVGLHRTSYVVLDEADRMLDMGFEPQIRQILKYARKDRQTLMFSATWPKEVRHLAQDFLGGNELLINIGSRDLTANRNIQQDVEFLESYDKLARTVEVVKETEGRILIFTETRRSVDQLVQKLSRSGVRALGLHGDKSQAVRDSTLSAFRDGRTPVLVATDVASRGLDVADIRLVINFELPNDIENYVHRIGRTGRADASGRSLAFLTDDDSAKAKELIGILEEAGQTVPDELRHLADSHDGRKKKTHRLPNRGYNDFENRGFQHRHRHAADHQHGGGHVFANRRERERHSSQPHRRMNRWDDDEYDMGSNFRNRNESY